MLIKDMFAKDIDRDIQGVIKVGQDNDENIRQELEEYVVTKELQKHFRDFFSNYKKAINGNTDKMGVWISGFFGSGKSHFLKILSYLLENRVVDGKEAFEYFLEDEKIADKITLADIRLACNTPTDVVLFNIDSKSKSSGSKGKDSILNVFLRVFNEMQGFSTDPHLADLERQLTEDGEYEEFKNRYKDLHNLDWIENRHKFKFHKDKVVKTLVDMDIMSELGARDWSTTTTRAYEISIGDFAKLVKRYLDSKGKNQHIIFLADEIGQYIGDDTDLMLNLQTITEDLGTHCYGKAWVVVTSQQDIDSITEVSGRDFSKIQGRFDTRLSLTSANVDEVIKLRILEKTPTANETLSVLYENKETIIKNLIIFNDGIEKKLYGNKKDFCQVYPFIPYQFNLLGSVLTSIREHGASGKHLSEGERSMLALFKESAEFIMNKEDGEMVSFNIFYDGLNKFLDHSHSAVITKAWENDFINPMREKDNFNVNVLKTLFMIKYIKEIEANLENITSLMVGNINDDRLQLKERVEEALRVLISQTLVQKNGDVYIFLTDEEQEVNREIDRQNIESQAITKKIGELIYAGILPEDKARYSKFGNRYNFGLNRSVDGESYKFHQSFDLGIDIISPNSEKNGIESVLRMNSQRENKIYIDLPSDRGFIDEIRTAMKIEKYINVSSTSNISKLEAIKALKRLEMREHHQRGKLFLEEALKEVDIYLNGEKLQLASKNFKYNVQETLEKAIAIVYHKLDYIDTPVDITMIRRLFKNRNDRNIELIGIDTPNINAINEVIDYIKIRTKNHSKISLKEIEERFKKAPYGFLDVDIEWIISKVFLDGNISFSLNGETVSLLNETDDELINYITKKQYTEKLLIEEKEIVEEKYIKNLKDLSFNIYNREIQSEDTDIMVKRFNENAQELINELNRLKENYKRGKYPGENTIEEGIVLINKTRGISKSLEVFKELFKNRDEYLDFGDAYKPIKSFFTGSQKDIWDKSQLYISIYNESKSFILNEDIETIVKDMGNILIMPYPYNNIKDLPDLNIKFMSIYDEILNKELKPVKDEIQKAEDRVMEELAKTGLKDKFEMKYINSFNDLVSRAENCNNVAKVNAFKQEAEILKMRYLDEISKEVENIIPVTPPGEKDPVIIKKTKNISIKEINPSNSWKIENKRELNRYIEELRNILEEELGENTILNIEF